MLAAHPVRIDSIQAAATRYDLLLDMSCLPRMAAYILACLLGCYRCGWFMMVQVTKLAEAPIGKPRMDWEPSANRPVGDIADRR